MSSLSLSRQEVDFCRSAGLEEALRAAVRQAMEEEEEMATGSSDADINSRALQAIAQSLSRAATSTTVDLPAGKGERRSTSPLRRRPTRKAEPTPTGDDVTTEAKAPASKADTAKALAAKAPASEDAEGGNGAFSQSAFAIARQRTPWLMLFLGGLLLCALVMTRFEALLERELELAFFVPMLIGHGGNSGGQAVSTVIRALGLRKGAAPRVSGVVFNEAIAGVLQSIVLASTLAPVLLFGMGISKRVVSVVAFSMPALGLLANTLGSFLPFLITKLGQDPAVIVGPLMTTLVDTLGLSIYLGIATVYLGLS